MSDRSGRIFVIEYKGETKISAWDFLRSLVPSLVKFLNIKESDTNLDEKEYLLNIIGKEEPYSLSNFRHNLSSSRDLINPGEKLLVTIFRNSAGWWESIDLVGLEDTPNEKDILYITQPFTLIYFPS